VPGPAEGQDRPVASTRAVDAAVAALLLVAGAVVMWDSVRIGFRWAADGPQAGYFPFYVGVLLCTAALWTLGRALLAGSQRGFVGAASLKAILSMLLPTIVYVGLIAWLGLYVASFAYVAFFMVWLGKYSWAKSLGVSAAVSVAAFLLFEVWFTMPLPKGPLEAMLGLV
jgi:putative tricarboxylic transport membrane protein